MPFTELRNGSHIADAAIRLAVALEARGHVLSVKAGALHVSNGSALTAEDRAAITAQRWHLMSIATYGQEDAWTATESEAHDLSIVTPMPDLPTSQTSRQVVSSRATSSTSKPSTKSIPSRSKPKKAASAFDWETTTS